MKDTTKPAYFIIQSKIKNTEDFMNRYGQYVFPIIGKYEGQMIAGSPTPKVLEGNWEGNWAAILRFPSLSQAEAFYNSPEYQPLRELRMSELTDGDTILLFEGN